MAFCQKKEERPARRCVLDETHIGDCQMHGMNTATVRAIERREEQEKKLKDLD